MDEIRHFDEKNMAESQYMPYFNVNIPKPHNMDSSMPVPVIEALKQKQTRVKRNDIDVAKPPKRASTSNSIEVIDDEDFEKRSIYQSGKWNEGSGECSIYAVETCKILFAQSHTLAAIIIWDGT